MWSEQCGAGQHPATLVPSRVDPPADPENGEGLLAVGRDEAEETFRGRPIDAVEYGVEQVGSGKAGDGNFDRAILAAPLALAKHPTELIGSQEARRSQVQNGVRDGRPLAAGAGL